LFLVLAIVVLFLLKAAFGEKELRRWKRARKINVRDCRKQGTRTIIYNGKSRRIKPLETFEKEGYSKRYLCAKVGFFGRTKTFDVAKITWAKK